MKKGWYMIVVSFLFWQQGFSQNFPELKFSLLSTANGLPTNLITDVFKNSRGLVWLGTQTNGLLRYDGKKIKEYHSTASGNNRIAASFTSNICEDKSGWLWVSSTAGLYHLDPVTDSVEVYLHDDKNEYSVATSNRPYPFVDSHNRLWIASAKGFQQFNAATKKFIRYSIPPVANAAWQVQASSVNNFFEDSRHRLWVGSAYGLYLVDTVNKKLVPFYTGFYSYVTSIYEDEQHRMWVSFWGEGLKRFYPETGLYESQPLTSGTLNCLTSWEDEEGKKWLCFTNYEGLVLYDPETKRERLYINDVINPLSLKGTYVNLIYKDDEGRLWIASGAGINLLDKGFQHFTNHLLYAGLPGKDQMKYGSPKALLVDGSSLFISNWYGGHLYEYDKQWRLKKFIDRIPPGSLSLHSTCIYTIEKDGQGNTWYGTDSGLVKQTGNNYKIYLPADRYPNLEARYAARNMIHRSDGLYWVRFKGRGVYLFDAEKGVFGKNYRSQFKGLTSWMAMDRKGELWLSTDSGMYVYKKPLDSFLHYPVVPVINTAGSFYNKILQFYFDESNTCWIATFSGLVKFLPDRSRFEAIIDPFHPTTGEAFAILPDSAGNIWIETYTGVAAYNKTSGGFRYFSADNGLPQGFLAFSGVFQFIDSSTIAMASSGIITTFNPYKLIGNTQKRPLVFTDISFDGKRFANNISPDGDNEIVVPAGTQSVNIHFALLNYTTPQQNRLYYRFQTDKANDWIETTDGDINLINLPPGRYKLEIRGESNGATADSSTRLLHLIVKPFWYQSVWFKALLALILVAGFYFFVRWRIRSVKHSAGLRQQVTETEMAALKAQMNPHFMFNCINSIDAFIHTNDKYNATLYLNKFAKLLRNVLDSSKQNLVPISKDMDTLKLYVELEELRSEGKFTSKFLTDDELLNIDYLVPPLIIQPFVENAILHGLRNRDDGNGMLTIEARSEADKIIYTISDNGIGRQAAAKINTGKQASYGLQMSLDRVRLFNKEKTPGVEIIDGVNGLGTTIIVQLIKR